MMMKYCLSYLSYKDILLELNRDLDHWMMKGHHDQVIENVVQVAYLPNLKQTHMVH